MNAQEFLEISDRIKARYGHLIEFDTDPFKYLTMDVIESCEELAIILPLLEGMRNTTLDDDTFIRALGILEGRVFHIIPHLESLYKAIKET